MNEPFAPGLLQRLDPAPRNVVLVRASRIGDFVCASPAFAALRAALPDARISLIALPFVRALICRTQSLDRFIEFPGYPGMAEQFFDPQRALSFLARMQGERFDLAIQMHGSGVHSNPFTLMLGASATAGFIRPEEDPGLLDAALPLPHQGFESERVLALTTFLGAPAVYEHPTFPLTCQDEAAAVQLFAAADRPLIGVHIGAREAEKRWPARAFAEAAETLQARRGGTVVILGGAAEIPAAIEVATTLSSPSINLAGQIGLPVLGAVVRQLSVLLTNDSGPAHIAYALGTPTVTIFRTTDPDRWGPTNRAGHRLLRDGPPMLHPRTAAAAAGEIMRYDIAL